MPKRTYVVTDYHADDGWKPYSNLLHDSHTDAKCDKARALDDAITAAGAVDGDEIEVIVRRTGRRPLGGRKMRLVRPNEYERDAASGSEPPEREDPSPLRCDKACGREDVAPCDVEPVLECRCARCASEPVEERFHCCQAHQHQAAERHVAIRGRRVTWGPLQAGVVVVVDSPLRRRPACQP